MEWVFIPLHETRRSEPLQRNLGVGLSSLSGGRIIRYSSSPTRDFSEWYKNHSPYLQPATATRRRKSPLLKSFKSIDLSLSSHSNTYPFGDLIEKS